jgi:AmmeMemoRadiSam system protein B
MEYPALRSIEAVPAAENMICLRDPLGFSDKMLLVPPQVFFVCRLFDGKHSILDIQAEYTRKFGDLLFSDRVKQIIEQLDECLFLEGQHFEEVRRRIEEEYVRSSVRQAFHAGLSYEADGDVLRSRIEGFFTQKEGPGLPTASSGRGDMTALMAPHIDLRRGSVCYAWSYRELAQECRARIFVIFGISHQETQRRFVLTTKSFQTPLGTAQTDVALIDRIVRGCSTDFFQDELIHRNEHSVEFQVLMLQYLFPNEEYRIVPILCSSFHHLRPEEGGADAAGEVKEFLSALRSVLSECGDDVCLIAGVDLSHVGQRFGQNVILSAGYLRNIELEDRRMLEQILKRDAEGFLAGIVEEKDRRNVCGVPAIYAFLNLVESGRANLLRYDQAVEDHTQSVVTFAGAGFYES